MHLTFPFNEKRATQAAALVIREMGGSCNYTWLLKVLYLADRQALYATGCPISGSTFVATNYGPLSSEVYDCIRNRNGLYPFWAEHIAKDSRSCALAADPGDSELSRFDERTLRDLTAKYRYRTPARMIGLALKLPEQRDYRPMPGSVRRIPPEAILRAVGVTEAEILYLAERDGHFTEAEV